RSIPPSWPMPEYRYRDSRLSCGTVTCSPPSHRGDRYVLCRMRTDGEPRSHSGSSLGKSERLPHCSPSTEQKFTRWFTHRPACHIPRCCLAQPPPGSVPGMASFMTRPPESALPCSATIAREGCNDMADATARKKGADLIKDFRFAMLTTQKAD